MLTAAGRADVGRDDALSGLPSPAPGSPFSPQDYYSLQQLQLRGRHSPHQSSYTDLQQQYCYPQPSIRIHPSESVQLTPPQQPASVASYSQQQQQQKEQQQLQQQQQRQQLASNETLRHWQQQNSIGGSSWHQPSSSSPTAGALHLWEDANIWDLNSDPSFGLSPAQTSTYLSQPLQQQQQQQQQRQEKRASSISSYASFGPHTPPPSGSQHSPSVEDFDAESLHYPAVDGFSQGLTQESLRDFDKFYAGYQHQQHHLAVPIEPTSHPPVRYSRDAQQIWQNNRRLAQQRSIMSQESQGLNGTMAPPTLPRTESTDTDGGFKTEHSMPKLDRTMSDVYQDTLFHSNTNDGYSPIAQTKPSSQESITRDVVTKRLAEAEHGHIKARSRSPNDDDPSRQHSPFKTGSLESPRRAQFIPCPDGSTSFQSAAQMREWEKARRDEVHAAQHTSAVKQELNDPVRTVSPKEVVALDFNEDESDSMGSLFPQEPPTKRQRSEHTTVSRTKPTVTRESTRMSDNSDLSFASVPSSNSRRESSQSANGGGRVQYPFFQKPRRQASTNSNNPASESQTPVDLPAQLSTSESARSIEFDQNPNRKRSYPSLPSPSTPKHRPSLSKQESLEDEDEDYTYTCTYHRCTKRFDSQSALQRHKREVHHSTAHHTRNSMSGTSLTSPTAQSPTGAQFTSANAGRQQEQQQQQQQQHHAKSESVDSDSATPQDTSGGDGSADTNSQAGPHICTRINPTTGKPCNSKFSRPYDLTRHEDTIHNSRKEKVKCALCKDEKTFSRSDALTRHMRVVHGQKDNTSGRGRGRA